MKIEIWENEHSIVAVVQNDADDNLLIEKDAILLRVIEGEDWDDCMKQHHELMGWEPYIPFEDGEL